ncbi:MAG: Rossmann-like and DUF2520 domain-containing protein [Thermodesulfobacteriota bacterium]
MPKPSFCIVGCGTLGNALGRLLFQAGYPVAGVASRTAVHARAAADILETDNWSTDPWEVTKKADLCFLTTTDSAIEGVCAAIADADGFAPGSVVLHSSGALTSEILVSARKCGARIGSMHPMQSFAGDRPGVNLFSGILVSLEGDPEALSICRQIVADLGANHARVRSEAKTLYHAAAVVASNYLVTILSMAFALNEAAGISPAESLQGLLPLIHGTLGNIQAQGIPNALTGPIARGDLTTVERHLGEIEKKIPRLAALYKSLGLSTTDVALGKGGIDEEKAEKFRKLFR